MMDYARRMVGSDTMDEEQLRQIREQQEVGVPGGWGRGLGAVGRGLGAVGEGGSMIYYARRMVGSDTMDEEQLRQIREQQEVCVPGGWGEG